MLNERLITPGTLVVCYVYRGGLDEYDRQEWWQKRWMPGEHGRKMLFLVFKYKRTHRRSRSYFTDKGVLHVFDYFNRAEIEYR